MSEQKLLEVYPYAECVHESMSYVWRIVADGLVLGISMESEQAAWDAAWKTHNPTKQPAAERHAIAVGERYQAHSGAIFIPRMIDSNTKLVMFTSSEDVSLHEETLDWWFANVHPHATKQPAGEGSAVGESGGPMSTLNGRNREEWHEHIDRLFDAALLGEEIPEAALLYGWKGEVTDEDREWARRVLAEPDPQPSPVDAPTFCGMPIQTAEWMPKDQIKLLGPHGVVTLFNVGEPTAKPEDDPRQGNATGHQIVQSMWERSKWASHGKDYREALGDWAADLLEEYAARYGEWSAKPKDDLAELGRLANLATPGLRVVDRDAIIKIKGDFDWLCSMQVSNQPNFANDAKFIAACSPEVISRLIERVRVAEERVVQWDQQAERELSVFRCFGGVGGMELIPHYRKSEADAVISRLIERVRAAEARLVLITGNYEKYQETATSAATDLGVGVGAGGEWINQRAEAAEASLKAEQAKVAALSAELAGGDASYAVGKAGK